MRNGMRHACTHGNDLPSKFVRESVWRGGMARVSMSPHYIEQNTNFVNKAFAPDAAEAKKQVRTALERASGEHVSCPRIT
jgi:hypothetical protein